MGGGRAEGEPRSYQEKLNGTERGECLETLFSCIELGKSTALLLDQIVLNSSNVFGGGEDIFPISHAFTEQNSVAFAGFWRPVLAMNGPDPARVGANPSYGIGACLQASADIQLQHD